MFYQLAAVLAVAQIAAAEPALQNRSPMITPAPNYFAGLNRRQNQCDAGNTACADGNGCCPEGSPCSTRESDGFPICADACLDSGVTCDVGPAQGLCCAIGQTCQNVSPYQCTNTGGLGGLSLSIPSLSLGSLSDFSIPSLSLPTESLGALSKLLASESALLGSHKGQFTLGGSQATQTSSSGGRPGGFGPQAGGGSGAASSNAVVEMAWVVGVAGLGAVAVML